VSGKDDAFEFWEVTATNWEAQLLICFFFLFFLKCGCRFAIALIMLDLFWKLADAEVWKEADHVVLGAYCIMI
jgi:hypothetical protein